MSVDTERGLLLVLLLHTAHLNTEHPQPDAELQFVSRGGAISLTCRNTVIECKIFRQTADRPEVVSDLSRNTSAVPDLTGRVLVSGMSSQYFDSKTGKAISAGTQTIKITNLTESDSGLYWYEEWEDGRLISRRQYSLTVCARKLEDVKGTCHEGDSTSLSCTDGSAPKGRTVLWYHHRRAVPTLPGTDPPSLVEDLGEWARVSDGNSSSLLLRDPRREDSGDYYCVVLEGTRCLSYQVTQLTVQIYVSVAMGGPVELPCFRGCSRVGWPVTWHTPFGQVTCPDTGAAETRSARREKGPVVSRNGSLAITAASLRHSGRYKCSAGEAVWEFVLTVCPEQDPVRLSVPPGGPAALTCVPDLVGPHRVSWYRRAPSHPDRPLSVQGARGHSLPIPSLGPGDGGEYWCEALNDGICFARRRSRLTVQGNPFGITSTFYSAYAALMAGGLLGMIAAVVTAWHKARRRVSSQARTRGRRGEPGEGRS
ncbi:cell adhesion molecule 4-like [Lepisosteus oculatus]|uniref:cell adhesion molecule 4-like n=1 Tax=Lepisosteus oculatus TaxID=7918 RepID=UPI0035F50074